jgi:hypothetical protein
MRFSLAILLLFCVPVAEAAPPAVKSLFPMGAALGTTTEITSGGKLNQPGTTVWCSEGSLKFEIPEKGDTFKVTVPDEASPGLHWVRFSNAEGATSLVPFVVGTLPELNETEPNNEIAKAQKIEKSSVANGKLAAAGDVDVFAVPVKKGQTLVASIDSNWRLAAPVDMVMQVLDPNGNVVEQNDDDHGFDPLIAVTPPEDGTWFVRVFGFPAKPNSTIRFAGGADYRYRLTLTTGPYANHAVPSAITEDGSAVGLAGWNLTEPLTKSVAVSSLIGDAFGLREIANTVPVSKLTGPVLVETEPSDRAKPGEITAGSVVCGVIGEPRDEDVFHFTAKKGERLNFRVESRSLGHPLDPVVTVIDAEGKLVIESDDSARNVFDSLVKFVAKADGEYRVCIRDLFENGGWRFAYRLHCEVPSPSVALAVKADFFNVKQGESLEIPVTVTRNEKFAEEVSVTVEGLPEGVTVAAVKSESKGDSSKAVKLTLKAESKTGFNGPIRIVGSYGEKLQVEATAPLATFKTKTTSLWLTIVPKKDEAKKEEPKK